MAVTNQHLYDKLEKLDEKLDSVNGRLISVETKIAINEKKKYGFNIPIKVGLITGVVVSVIGTIINFFFK